MSDHPNTVNLVRRGEPQPTHNSREDDLAWLLSRHRFPPAEREYRFHHRRRWRFDFAWPGFGLALELDGLVRSGRGGHQTVDGILADAEKAEAALLAGWIIYRVPTQWLDQRPLEVLDTVRRLLNHRGAALRDTPLT